MAILQKIEQVGQFDGTNLIDVSDCNSQCGGEFDGPVLWSDEEDAEDTLCEYGGMPDDHQLVKVTIIVESLEGD